MVGSVAMLEVHHRMACTRMVESRAARMATLWEGEERRMAERRAEERPLSDDRRTP
jgi:hypothetical protein